MMDCFALLSQLISWSGRAVEVVMLVCGYNGSRGGHTVFERLCVQRLCVRSGELLQLPCSHVLDVVLERFGVAGLDVSECEWVPGRMDVGGVVVWYSTLMHSSVGMCEGRHT